MFLSLTRTSKFLRQPRVVLSGVIRLLVVILTIALAACGGGGSGTGGGGFQPQLSLAATPNPIFIYPNSSFSVQVTATTNTSKTPAVTLGMLPPGITATTTFPVSVPSGGASITFQTTSTIAAGAYTVTLNGQAGAAAAPVSILITVQNGQPPPFSFATGVPAQEIATSPGSSGNVQFLTGANGADYNVQLSVTGLPPGTTATINPPTILPGQSVTVTVTASSTAPAVQNVAATLTGTPMATASSGSTNFLVDVMPPSGSLPNNRTDYISTEDTPFSAVYDPVHQLIFASNNLWNRVDVISTVSHAIVSHILIPEPQGVDITQDHSTVWISSGSGQVFAIDTSSMAVSRHRLPPSGSAPYSEEGRLFALSDGTIMIVLTGTSGIAIWDPVSNTVTFPPPPPTLLVNGDGIYRSGDGKRVYFIASDTGGAAFHYDVQARSFSGVATLAGLAITAAVNVDGSRVVVCDANGPNMYDGNFNLIGPLPACGFGSVGTSGQGGFFEGGSVFSTDNLYLYQVTLANVPMIIKIDANTLNILSEAPAMPMIPVTLELLPPFFVPIPFAVDDTGMVFGIEDWGIAFDDAAYAQTYSSLQLGTPTFMQHMDPYFGPLQGGTTSGFLSNVFSITPDVWYGAKRGRASLNSDSTVSITSPPGVAPGPVNVKLLYPDGMETFDPLFFSYGPFLQYPLVSGASPQGNVPAQIVGYGLPGDDNTTGTLNLGSSRATLTPPGASGLPYAGTPFPSKILTYTVPPGLPGWNDITLTTPDGTSTLPKSFFYAKSVTDYPSSDTFTAILYDSQRQQLYLSAGDHVDVFSLLSNQFASPLFPPSVGASKLFAGLALTPGGSLLLATDLLDGSLAVVDPNNPGTSYAIPVMTPTGTAGCPYGPIYVASTINNYAYVLPGGLPGPACSPGGSLYQVNLSSRTASFINPGTACFSGGTSVASTHDGTKLVFDGCVFDAVAQKYSGVTGVFQALGAAIAGDGSVTASEWAFLDTTPNEIGRVARPDIYYSVLGTSAQPNLLEPQLNDAGSLYYMPYANMIDIVDVQHMILRIRFSLGETISNTAVPMAIDSGGRFIFLITNRGLTIVDLGEASLSVGWLKPTSASPGMQVFVRGSGFDSSTTATVNGQAAAVAVVDQNTLNLTIPGVGFGPATIVLTNGDGTRYTDSNLLTIQ